MAVRVTTRRQGEEVDADLDMLEEAYALFSI